MELYCLIVRSPSDVFLLCHESGGLPSLVCGCGGGKGGGGGGRGGGGGGTGVVRAL